MNKEIDNFLNEFTDNFSDLLVETFFIRYIGMYGNKNISESINKLKILLMNKIDIKINKKLN